MRAHQSNNDPVQEKAEDMISYDEWQSYFSKESNECYVNEANQMLLRCLLRLRGIDHALDDLNSQNPYKDYYFDTLIGQLKDNFLILVRATQFLQQQEVDKYEYRRVLLEAERLFNTKVLCSVLHQAHLDEGCKNTVDYEALLNHYSGYSQSVVDAKVLREIAAKPSEEVKRHCKYAYSALRRACRMNDARFGCKEKIEAARELLNEIKKINLDDGHLTPSDIDLLRQTMEQAIIIVEGPSDEDYDRHAYAAAIANLGEIVNTLNQKSRFKQVVGAALVLCGVAMIGAGLLFALPSYGSSLLAAVLGAKTLIKGNRLFKNPNCTGFENNAAVAKAINKLRAHA